jgi:hypothetical protein
MKKMTALIVVALLCGAWFSVAAAKESPGVAIKLTNGQLTQIKQAAQAGKKCSLIDLTPGQITTLKNKFNDLQGLNFKAKMCLAHVYDQDNILIDSTLTGLASIPK